MGPWRKPPSCRARTLSTAQILRPIVRAAAIAPARCVCDPYRQRVEFLVGSLPLTPALSLHAGRGGGNGALGDAFVGEALHLLHVFAFDADKTGCAFAPWRVQIAFVIEIGHSGCQRVILDVPRLAWPTLAGPRDRLIIGHDRLAGCLTIDRPGRPVIMRIAVLGAVIHMTENAKAELRILVQ